MPAQDDRVSEMVELGPVQFKDKAFTAEFKLKPKGSAPRRVKYVERKLPDNSIGYMGLEIELNTDMEGNIFRQGGSKSVGAVFMKQKGRSLPFGVSLGNAIRGNYSPELIQTFSDFLQKEGYTFAAILWEDALSMLADKK